jgi:hypothetical protein
LEKQKRKTMHLKINLLIVALLLGLSSCAVFSVHPLYDDSSLTTDDNLAGLWFNVSDSETYVRIEPVKNYYKNDILIKNCYSLIRTDKGDTIWYEAHYLKLQNDYYLDLYPIKGGGIEPDEMMARNYFPVHSFIKMELEPDKAIVFTFDENKLLQLFKQNRIRLQHEMIDEYVLITASTKDLQQFIEKYSADKGVFEKPDIFIRLKE